MTKGTFLVDKFNILDSNMKEIVKCFIETFSVQIELYSIFKCNLSLNLFEISKLQRSERHNTSKINVHLITYALLCVQGTGRKKFRESKWKAAAFSQVFLSVNKNQQ